MNPSTLLNSCVKFISKNVIYVESLLGIPDHIGKDILRECINDNLFINDKKGSIALKIFIEGYGCDFLSYFKCSDIIVINQFSKSIEAILYQLTELNLSGSNLGDNHDLLASIKNITLLQTLNLSHNKLTDIGFKIVFNTFIVMNIGFRKLEMLDITCNKISLKFLHSVLKLPLLEKIAFSLESGKASETDFEKLFKENNFSERPYDVESPNLVQSGWGREVICIWKDCVSATRLAVKYKQPWNETITKNFFYSRSNNAKDLLLNSKVEIKFKTLFYCKNATSKITHEKHELRKKPKVKLSYDEINNLLS